MSNVNTISSAVEDFSATFDIKEFNDKASIEKLEKYLAEQKLAPAAGYQEGYTATVLAIKANEAVTRGGRVDLPKGLFELS
jgi:hypothetical protein